MPDTADLLRKPEDMCIGPLKDGRCGCLMYWRVKLLDRVESGRICRALVELFGDHTTWPIDKENLTPADAAEIWNAALHQIGYTEGNPMPSAERIAELREKWGVA